jgi:hypothetical protein
MNLRILAEVDREVVVHRLVVQEILFNHVSAISEAKNEVAEPVVSVQLHDVPEYRPSPDVHQRFGSKLSFFS